MDSEKQHNTVTPRKITSGENQPVLLDQPTNDCVFDSSSLKVSLSHLLSDTGSVKYQRAVIYIVYRTIEHNKMITLNQLKHLLLSDLLLGSQLIDGAVAVLASKSVFASITMFQIKSTGAPNFHLDAKPTAIFEQWLKDTQELLPELKGYTIPVYTKKQKDGGNKHETVLTKP